MAAAACFSFKRVGLTENPILSIPAPMAPEDTNTISFPLFSKSVRTLANASIFLKFTFPVGYVMDDVPIFSTMRFASFAFVRNLVTTPSNSYVFRLFYLFFQNFSTRKEKTPR
jgi:hypothetical protein